jgi:hypothetical protein
MTRLSKSTGIVAAAIGVALWTGGADATVVRAWVSGHGNDVAGCGAPANPCRTLQYSHDNIVSAGGEIDILDPAGYGTLTITKAISVVNDGVGTAGVQTNSGSAITIAAGPSDSVYLRGLNIDGLQRSGRYGIEFQSGGALTVVNCFARHFSAVGLYISPTSGPVAIGIHDSFFQENNAGIYYNPLSGNPSVTGIIDHVRANKNDFVGISLDTIAPAAGHASFTISNSDVSNNDGYGIQVSGVANNMFVEIDASTLENNLADGLSVAGATSVHLARSVLDANGVYGIENQSSSPGGVFSSGDNHLEGNGTAAIHGVALAVDAMH